MFNFFSKEKQLIQRYQKHTKTKEYNAEIFVRQKVKSISLNDIVIINSMEMMRSGLFRFIRFSVYKRKMLAKSRRSKNIDEETWRILQAAKQYQLDLETMRSYKKSKSEARHFLLTGEMKKKPDKSMPPVLIKSTPAEIIPLGEKFKNKERVDLNKILPYLNPDYLDYEPEKYVVKYEEITKCLPRNQTQKRQKKKSLENELQPKSK